jgi:DNA polymerase I-like protein with 3'-5' exonuclease and polymerase domains
MDLSLSWGTDAKKVLAFFGQSTAAGIMKESMLELAAWPDILDSMIWTIHDELIFELPADRFREMAAVIMATMGKPRPELGGIAIGVEAEYGTCWGEMHGLEDLDA